MSSRNNPINCHAELDSAPDSSSSFMKFDAKILVTLKPEVKDAKAQVLEQIIRRKDCDASPECHTGQYFQLTISAKDENEAREKTKKIANEILSNSVIETYEILTVEKV